MEVGKTTRLYSTRFLKFFERVFTHKGKESTWYFCSREEPPVHHVEKKPNAVVIVGITGDEDPWKVEPRLVMTSEYRVPIMAREWGFPAGLIEEGEDPRDAAIREFKEEVGMDFTPMAVSAPNLYSSAGMSNESVQIVFGKASGMPSTDLNEASEDIQIFMMTQYDILRLLEKCQKNETAVSDKAWCLLWHFSQMGLKL